MLILVLYQLFRYAIIFTPYFILINFLNRDTDEFCSASVRTYIVRYIAILSKIRQFW